jgi:plasmid stabilization system protein ParE
MRLRFTPRALHNIAGIADFLEERNPAAAERVQSDIFNALDGLTMFPHIGRRQSAPGVRRVLTKTYRYLIYYTVDNEAAEVVVLNVKHPAAKREYFDL